jgi:Lar family restriction alleviation protein
MDKLLNCPFCGSEPEIIRVGNCHTKSRRAIVWCKGCNVQKVVGAIVYNLDWCEATAIAQWNRRAPSAEERELRDCLRDVLFAALIGPELRNRARALLAKKGS